MITNLYTKPCWLTTVSSTGKIENIDFGFDKKGMWFTGNANGGTHGSGPGGGYPVVTNFEMNTNDVCRVVYTINHNDHCADQGICFFNSSFTPEWQWNNNPTRIAFSVNCPVPHIYGQMGYATSDNEPVGTGYYTFVVTYDPGAGTVTALTYTGNGTDGDLVDTLTFNETLPPGPYKVGFSADQDNFGERAYFRKVEIFKNNIAANVSKQYSFNFSPPAPYVIPGYVGEGCLDPYRINGYSVQRTGYYEVVDACGNRKIVEVKDGEIINDAPQSYPSNNDLSLTSEIPTEAGPIGPYYLRESWTTAEHPGWITFPDHQSETGSINPNDVGVCNNGMTSTQIYINQFSEDNKDHWVYLDQLNGNYTNLTLTQGSNSVTYYCTNLAFVDDQTPEEFDDNYFSDSPCGAITVISPASGDFNTVDPIYITVAIVPKSTPTPTPTPTPVPTPTPTHVPGVDFTIEWFQKSVGSFGSHPRIYSLGSFPAPNAISIESAGSHIYWWVSGSYKADSVISQSLDTWYHYAVVRNNGLLKIFQNGVQVGSSSTWNDAISSASNTLYIGAEPGPTSLFHGNITNFRWTVNAIYDSNFTPPSSPLTALPDTKLLLLATDSGSLLTDSSGSAKIVTNVGTATWSSDSPFGGSVGGSISLNGTSQYLTIPSSIDWDL